MELKLWNNRPKGKKINISKKEKNLLLILGLSIIFWLSYSFVFTPQHNNINKLKTEKINYEVQLQKIDDMLLREKSIKNEWAKLRGDFLEVSDKYFHNINQPEIMHLLNTIIDGENLEISAMSFKDPETVELKGLYASYMGINIPFKGSYADLKSFISFIRNNSKKLLINQISLFKENENNLTGEIGLEVYAYGNKVEMREGYFYNNNYSNSRDTNPFTPFEGYAETIENPDIISDTEDTIGVAGNESRIVINDLEADNIYFMSPDEGVTGEVSRISKSKYGKSSIRTEYFISTDFNKERAYVVLDDMNIVIKYPPNSIGLWSYAYGYSPITIGLRFQNMDGEKVDVELAKGVNWMGWEYVSAAPPQDINVYPLKLDRIYFELGPNRNDYGVLLFDRIEANYPESKYEKEENVSYIFYVVKPGDTLMSISENFYGSNSQYKRIMKDNGLMENSALEAGKVLVIQR